MAPASGDLDGDGRTDLALGATKGVDVFLQRSGGLSLSGLVDLPDARQVSLVDLDADGHLDLVVNTLAGVLTLAGAGGGAFGAPTPIDGIHYAEVETGDVTGDGLRAATAARGRQGRR